jgi:hypothetical protein
MKRLSKYAFRIAVIALAWIPVQASAQTLTLDDYTSGTYVKRIINPNVCRFSFISRLAHFQAEFIFNLYRDFAVVNIIR